MEINNWIILSPTYFIDISHNHFVAQFEISDLLFNLRRNLNWCYPVLNYYIVLIHSSTKDLRLAIPGHD